MQLGNDLMTSLVAPRKALPSAGGGPARSKPRQSQEAAYDAFLRGTAALPLSTVYSNLRGCGYDHKAAWAGVMDTLRLKETFIDRPRRVREAVEAARRG